MLLICSFLCIFNCFYFLTFFFEDFTVFLLFFSSWEGGEERGRYHFPKLVSSLGGVTTPPLPLPNLKLVWGLGRERREGVTTSQTSN